MPNQINYKEYHINKDGKKVAGTAHQIHIMKVMKRPDPFVMTSQYKHKIDPFVILKSEKKDKNEK